MCWCHFIDLLKFETRLSSLLNFGTAFFVVEHYPFLKAVFLKRNCSVPGPDNVCGQISEQIFTPEGDNAM